MKSCKRHKDEETSESSDLSCKPIPAIDYIERFSKEYVTKYLNEKDAKLIYLGEPGIQGSKKHSGLVNFKKSKTTQ